MKRPRTNGPAKPLALMNDQNSKSARWHYRDVTVEYLATLVHNGQRYAVPMYGGESVEHAMFKVSIAAHLLAWGYEWEQIWWEKGPSQGPPGCRPDIYAKGNHTFPSFWFECGGAEAKKLKTVIAALPDFRVVSVIDYEWFRRVWKGETIFVVGGKVRRLDQIQDRKERKRLLLGDRQSFVLPGGECWAMRGAVRSPRIIYAVRRAHDGRFTYLDTGEGWAISSFRYISKVRDGFQPLIPGVVGKVTAVTGL